MTSNSYDAPALARWVAEPPKGAGRSAFERDRARVLHSASLRRLAAKTQVVEVGRNDFPRTRLTHTLEVAQIGRGIAGAIGCDPDVVETACLAHDIGHPPFGHNGELALAELAAGCGGFEGNAQTLRLLTRLETKVPGAGLNLTRASLDAVLKYPWPEPMGGGKYNYYADDAPAFSWIRQGAPDRRRCLEAQVMDWADDVAYSVHDLEDGLNAGLVTFGRLHDPAERASVAEVTLQWYLDPAEVSLPELTAVFDDLMTLDCWPKTFDGGPDALAALKNLTSELVGRFCVAAQDATRAACAGDATAGSLRRYMCNFVVPRRQRLECALLKGVAARYVMAREGAAAQQARERELIAELAATIQVGAPRTLDPLFRPAWQSADSDPARRRVVIDQIASLTDTSARSWHHRLTTP
ncbi:MAG TPA: deoxyguanosinetriphosphate triphosphohydrolase [Streptosporangiaceae bacterium]|nr:deoxyguanosinetriphosphate triphosphohydrolase [Streptosporangiaceae bacterium]